MQPSPFLRLVVRSNAPAQTQASLRAPMAPEDEPTLIARMVRGERAAAGVLFDRHAPTVERVLLRILGSDAELADVVQDVFVRAFEGIRGLRDPSAFVGWLRRLTVCAAMDLLRSRRRRRRWLWFLPAEEVPEIEAPGVDDVILDAVRATYVVMDSLPLDDRVAFSLRVIDDMPLADVALACDCSLATVKRRIARASQAFEIAARSDPALRAWVGVPANPAQEKSDALRDER